MTGEGDKKMGLDFDIGLDQKGPRAGYAINPNNHTITVPLETWDELHRGLADLRKRHDSLQYYAGGMIPFVELGFKWCRRKAVRAVFRRQRSIWEVHASKAKFLINTVRTLVRREEDK